ncbi:putative gamma-glutamylcyclotransferase CG2811 isoform X1 [Argonauta hians]
MASRLERVFVYGTLKRGQPNHIHLENAANGLAKFIGEAYTKHTYPLVVASDSNIPFMLPFEGKGKLIQGELYDVDENMLERLDKMELHPNVYKRQQIPITFSDQTYQSWTYILQRPKARLLDLNFLDNYDNNKQPEERKYVPKDQRKISYPLQVMEDN